MHYHALKPVRLLIAIGIILMTMARATPFPYVSAAPISDVPHCTDAGPALAGADTTYTDFRYTLGATEIVQSLYLPDSAVQWRMLIRSTPALSSSTVITSPFALFYTDAGPQALGDRTDLDSDEVPVCLDFSLSMEVSMFLQGHERRML